MARAVPLLPCGELDPTVAFYVALGFEVVVRQDRPRPFAAFRRDDIDLRLDDSVAARATLDRLDALPLTDDDRAAGAAARAEARELAVDL